MDFSDKVLGTGTVNKLRASIATPILQIGADTFTRSQLSKVECFNFVACRLLTFAVTQVLKVKDTRDLFERHPPEALAMPRVGIISLAVLGAAFEAKHIGGEAPLMAWMKKHQANGRGLVTFATVKANEAKEAGKERQARKRRKRARRDEAHATRVARFMERQPTQ